MMLSIESNVTEISIDGYSVNILSFSVQIFTRSFQVIWCDKLISGKLAIWTIQFCALLFLQVNSKCIYSDSVSVMLGLVKNALIPAMSVDVCEKSNFIMFELPINGHYIYIYICYSHVYVYRFRDPHRSSISCSRDRNLMCYFSLFLPYILTT